MPSQTVLVTGGAGFIGSHIADALLHEGYRVKIIDNLFAGKKENIQHVFDQIEFIQADIRNYSSVERAMQNTDFVLHQAALRSVPASLKNPSDYNDVNINGTLNILQAAHQHNVSRVVFASSSSVYGNAKTFPEKETLTPAPLSPYALTKLAGEHYCKIFSEIYGLETVSLRYFNVYGPRQDLKAGYATVIPLFITRTLQGQPSTIFGDGSMQRDFTFVKDVVQANLAAMRAKTPKGEVFNVGAGKSHSVLFLHQKIQEILGKSIPPVFENARAGDVQKTQADPTKANKKLGFSCHVSFEEGLRQTADWFINNPINAKPK